MRELGVVLIVIFIVGCFGSVFIVEIGLMKVNEEIDVMWMLGLDLIEVFVILCVLVFVLMMLFFMFIVDVMGIFGGLFVFWVFLDILLGMFFIWMVEMVLILNFWVGMIKVFVFVFVIGLIGCYEGLNVEGSVEFVGMYMI